MLRPLADAIERIFTKQWSRFCEPLLAFIPYASDVAPEVRKKMASLLASADSLGFADKTASLLAVNKSESHEQGHDLPSSEAQADTGTESVFVPLAGMVIVHPFLNQLFKRLGLDLKDRMEQRERAVHVLYYMGTGAQYPPEHDCAFLKILCGLELSFPLIRDLELNKTELAEADSCLHAVISNWSKLGSTSLEGLRETFLQREGKLEKEADHWTITIDKRGPDILMDFMPWSVTVLKLPWTDRPILVNWR